MWLLFGVLAVVLTIANWLLFLRGKKHYFFMGLALSFTALVNVVSYQMVGAWAEGGDIAALLDVAPTMSVALWIFTLISVVLNMLPLGLSKSRNQ